MESKRDQAFHCVRGQDSVTQPGMSCLEFVNRGQEWCAQTVFENNTQAAGAGRPGGWSGRKQGDWILQ